VKPRRGSLLDWLIAGSVATALSGIPSTLYSALTGADIAEPTRAAGAMLIAPNSSDPQLLIAAAVVHIAVSFFWSGILIVVLPRVFIAPACVLAALLIGVLDLRVIAPHLYPEVARLPFLPQMADHLMWGACLGLVLRRRWRAIGRVSDVAGDAKRSTLSP
jgi:hypothetical protein